MLLPNVSEWYDEAKGDSNDLSLPWGKFVSRSQTAVKRLGEHSADSVYKLISSIAANLSIELEEIERLRTTTIKPTSEVNAFLEKNNSSVLSGGIKLVDLLKRSELNYEKLKEIDINRPELSAVEAEEVEIQVKYEGYIKLQEAQVDKSR